MPYLRINLGDTKSARELRDIGITLKRTSLYIWIQCPDCKENRWVSLRSNNSILKDKPFARCRPCSCRENRRLGAIKRWGYAREHNPMWKGGRSYQGGGYIQVRLYPESFFYSMGKNKKGMGEGRYVPEHRLVMAQSLGRCLQEWEIVHHKNGIKDDNRIENLELSNRFDHMQAHGKGYRDGYQKGLLDAHEKRIKILEARITQLEASNVLLENQLKEVQFALLTD